MLNRIRHLKENTITILNQNFKYYPTYKNYFYNYDDIKQSMLNLEHYQLQCENVIINNKICKQTKLTNYDVNYIHNRKEQMNTTDFYFIAYLKMLLENKGHTVNIYDEKNTKEIDDGQYKQSKKDIILNTEDITSVTFDELLKKQTKDDATEEEKNQITRHIYKKNLGIDFLTFENGGEEFYKTFTTNSIKNFLSLIDLKNIKNSDDNKTIEMKDKAILINKLINDIGYNHIFDDKFILQSDFESKMKNIVNTNILFTDVKNTKIRFNLSHFNQNIKTVKQYLGQVNSLLISYHIKISYDRKRINGEREAGYVLETIDYINELVEYKKMKGFEIIDDNNIRKPSTTDFYKDFIDFEKLKNYKKIDKTKTYNIEALDYIHN